MPVHFTSREITEKYDRFGRWYDLVEGIPDFLGVRKLRQRVLQRALGKVLEVAVTGKNLPYYPPGCRIIAMDVSREMLNVARQRAAKLSMDVSFSLADAAALPFSDKSFDTVVSSVTTCTFPEPVSALREMARVCKTEGRVLLLSTVAVTVNGSAAGKIAGRIALQSNSAVTGIESLWSLFGRRV